MVKSVDCALFYLALAAVVSAIRWAEWQAYAEKLEAELAEARARLIRAAELARPSKPEVRP